MVMESCGDPCCGPAASAALPAPERITLTRRAFRLEWLTVAWMIVEGALAIGAGIAVGSLTLTAFGLDSVIELASALVLIWRLNVELRHGQAFSERAERIASKISGGLLFALAVYIVGGAAWSLWTQHGESFSLPGLIVALLAIPIMTLLARRKIAIATQLGSRAMRADAVESITCGWLSLVVVIGLIVGLLLGVWWADAVTALAIVWFVVKEGREAWKGEDCCDHD
jgi:divalent metal cation (Fe/Co/Zn/Cd) transporter